MLKDVIPEKHRKRVYAAVTLAAAIFGAWQASEGNWDVFVASVLTFLTTSLATSNTDGPLLPKRGEDGVSDFGLLAAVVIGALLLFFLVRR